MSTLKQRNLELVLIAISIGRWWCNVKFGETRRCFYPHNHRRDGPPPQPRAPRLHHGGGRASEVGADALITTAQGKFFSNGYDQAWALSEPARPKIISKKLRLLVEDSLPMPTIAAVNGHASATGFILALSHDYLLMRRQGRTHLTSITHTRHVGVCVNKAEVVLADVLAVLGSDETVGDSGDDDVASRL
ncbi:hypothetical protein SASPL_138682 [Salvia splendens]|uniref:Uncharacterized protein n=1 Tax=Salvia splendens TaxID=180675 RepID=A0A8X8WVN3_SALSN|nr:hypothetical protein SASPL_138682 [Salvia splendens]